MANTVTEIYAIGLRNAHALENQAIQLLSRQVERIESYPEMRDMLARHLEESRIQATRIEQILQGMGTSHSVLKDAVVGFMGNVAALAHAPMQDEILKNTFANFAFEHFEIASYRSLLAMADAAGDSSGPQLLRLSLAEEERMAAWIGDNIEKTTRTYVALESSGQKSGI